MYLFGVNSSDSKRTGDPEPVVCIAKIAPALFPPPPTTNSDRLKFNAVVLEVQAPVEEIIEEQDVSLELDR